MLFLRFEFSYTIILSAITSYSYIPRAASLHYYFVNNSLFMFYRLEKLGGLEWNKVVHEHQGWRLITSIWMHAGVIHLLANMLSLVFIGIRLEQQFGFGMV